MAIKKGDEVKWKIGRGKGRGVFQRKLKVGTAVPNIRNLKTTLEVGYFLRRDMGLVTKEDGTKRLVNLGHLRLVK